MRKTHTDFCSIFSAGIILIQNWVFCLASNIPWATKDLVCGTWQGVKNHGKSWNYEIHFKGNFLLTKINVPRCCHHFHGLHSLTFSLHRQTALTALKAKHGSMLFSEQQLNSFSWCVTPEGAISDVIKQRSQTCYSTLSLSQSLGICWVIKNLANHTGIQDAGGSTPRFGLFSLIALCTRGPFWFWSLLYLSSNVANRLY